MFKLLPFALILIAGVAINTRATGMNVYKCGSTYSQTPCESAVPMRVEDGRSAAQKVQADAATKHQARTANTLEETRVKEESQALATAIKLNQASAKAAAQNSKKKAAQEAKVAEKPIVLNPPAAKGKSKRAAEYFTAKASTSPSKPASGARP